MGEVKFNKKVPNLPKSRVLKWGVYLSKCEEKKCEIGI